MSACNGFSSGMAVERHIRDKLIILQNLLRRNFHVRPSTEIQVTSIMLTIYDHLDAINRFHNETLRVYGVLEIRLSGKFTGEPRDYLAGAGKGKYSVADIGTWTWVKGWEFSGFTHEEMKEFPHLMNWIARIAERPAVKRGIGEKYQNKVGH
jgi:glutathione S-transferase